MWIAVDVVVRARSLLPLCRLQETLAEEPNQPARTGQGGQHLLGLLHHLQASHSHAPGAGQEHPVGYRLLSDGPDSPAGAGVGSGHGEYRFQR